VARKLKSAFSYGAEEETSKKPFEQLLRGEWTTYRPRTQRDTKSRHISLCSYKTPDKE